MPELRQRHAIRSLSVFGSRSRGNESTESDLDLLVTFDKPPGLLQFMELENELEDALGVPVDLVMEEALRSEVRSRVLKDVIAI